MVQHKIVTGSLLTAEEYLLANGGQLFAARDEQGPWINLRGQTCLTTWPEISKRRGYCRELAIKCGYDPEIATTGRIIRYLMNEILEGRHKNTTFDVNWYRMARRGAHWHYIYSKPGVYDYVFELDLKSAYWTSFINGNSAFITGAHKWLDDGGMLDSLSGFMEGKPKAFRLAMLGTFASWNQKFYTRNKKNPASKIPVLNTRNHVEYGALFNATHRAIHRVYKFMEYCHHLVGDSVVRCHTDSLTVDCSDGMPWEKPLFDAAQRAGFRFEIKGHGQGLIIDDCHAIIGRKIIGAHCQVSEFAKKNGIKINLNAKPPRQMDLFPLSKDLSEVPASVAMDVP